MQSRNRLGCHRKYITGYSEIDGSDERKTATCTYIERHFGPRWQLRFSYSFTNRSTDTLGQTQSKDGREDEGRVGRDESFSNALKIGISVMGVSAIG